MVVRRAAEAASVDALPVTEHGIRVSYLANLLKEMADIDDGDSLALQPTNQLKKPDQVRRRQTAGWLIHQDDFGAPSDRAADFYDLARCKGQGAQPPIGIDFRMLKVL